MLTHVIFLGVIYPIIGLVLARVTMGENLLQLAYPLIGGFGLIGPFATVGLYELSRRRQQGLDVSWSHAFDIFYSPSSGTIAALVAVQMLLFIAWIATAHGAMASRSVSSILSPRPTFCTWRSPRSGDGC